MTTLKGPDGFGFLYGQSDTEPSISINLMPPGGGKFGTADDPHRWIAYVDGDEIGRFDHQYEAEEAVAARVAALTH